MAAFKQDREMAKRASKRPSTGTTRPRRARRNEPPETTERVVSEPTKKGAPVIVTIGYEQRDGAEVMDLLTERGVSYLADIRQRPFSRKLDFRGGALMGYCKGAGIEYVSWPSLGSTREQRDEKEATGDIGAFQRAFMSHAKEFMDQPGGPLEELAGVVERRAAKDEKVALLCYERLHDDCHRKAIAQLLAERLGAGVLAVE